jgi:peptidoglycan/LPS O-acetylase OafA/YrhL
MVLHFAVMAPATGLESAIMAAVGIGWAGVDLFFVLSGFLITGILIDARGGDGYFRNFYMRRALRIFPLYYLFLAVIFWVLPLLTGAGRDPLGPQLWMLSYLGNFLFSFGGWEAVPGHTTHLWSLAIEEQFYLIWPFVVFHASRRALIRVCLGAIGAAWLFRLAMFAFVETGIPGYALLPARMDALALGGLLAIGVRTEGWVERARPLLPPAVLMGCVLLLINGLLGGLLSPDEGPFNPLQMHTQLLGYPAVDLLSACLVTWAVLPGGGEGSRILTNEALQRLGKYSYALYLLHIPLRNLVVNRIFPGGELPTLWGSQLPVQLLLIPAAIGVTYLVALASWHLFESRFLLLKKHFEYRGGEASLEGAR